MMIQKRSCLHLRESAVTDAWDAPELLQGSPILVLEPRCGESRTSIVTTPCGPQPLDSKCGAAPVDGDSSARVGFPPNTIPHIGWQMRSNHRDSANSRAHLLQRNSVGDLRCRESNYDLTGLLLTDLVGLLFADLLSPSSAHVTTPIFHNMSLLPDLSDKELDSLKGRTIIITGGASGIGRAAVRLAHSRVPRLASAMEMIYVLYHLLILLSGFANHDTFYKNMAQMW